jgi:hypothetical protein
MGEMQSNRQWIGCSEMAGVEFTNGDQPGVRLTKAAATHSTVTAKAAGRKTAKATEKKR